MSLNVELIRKSFDMAKPIGMEVAEKFYEILWEDFPAVKAMFQGLDMQTQKRALMSSLTFVVDNVDNPEKLIPYLKSMGERHVKYGVEEEHYEWVGQSLLKTFVFFFEDNWTDELQDEWISAYNVVANTMQEGAAEYIPALGDLQLKAKKICDSLLYDMVESAIDDDFEQYVRARVRRVLFKVLEEESDELFNKSA